MGRIEKRMRLRSKNSAGAKTKMTILRWKDTLSFTYGDMPYRERETTFQPCMQFETIRSPVSRCMMTSQIPRLRGRNAI